MGKAAAEEMKDPGFESGLDFNFFFHSFFWRMRQIFLANFFA